MKFLENTEQRKRSPKKNPAQFWTRPKIYSTLRRPERCIILSQALHRIFWAEQSLKLQAMPQTESVKNFPKIHGDAIFLKVQATLLKILPMLL